MCDRNEYPKSQGRYGVECVEFVAFDRALSWPPPIKNSVYAPVSVLELVADFPRHLYTLDQTYNKTYLAISYFRIIHFEVRMGCAHWKELFIWSPLQKLLFMAIGEVAIYTTREGAWYTFGRVYLTITFESLSVHDVHICTSGIYG